MHYEPKTLLVTGGAGFIGTNFVHYWLQTYPNTRLVILDALTYAGRYENLQSLKAKLISVLFTAIFWINR